MDNLTAFLARPKLLTILLTVNKAVDLAKSSALRDLKHCLLPLADCCSVEVVEVRLGINCW